MTPMEMNISIMQRSSGDLNLRDMLILKSSKKSWTLVKNGLTFGAPTEKEVILAELISELIPSMEVSRLVSSGTEAVMSAIRAARGFTGRDKDR